MNSNFIKLTTLDEEAIFVRSDCIHEVWTYPATKRTPAHTGISTPKGTWRVAETPDWIFQMIDNVGKIK